jgi:hypothetical protein
LDHLATSDMHATASTPLGRSLLLSSVVSNEMSAVRLLSEILHDIKSVGVDERIVTMVERHRNDEIRHDEIIRERMSELGFSVAALDAFAAPGLDLYERLRPRDFAEKYAIIQVMEETAEDNYSAISTAFRGSDKDTAKLLDLIVYDERSHLKYCSLIAREFGGATHEALISSYRDEVKAMMSRNRSGSLPPIEIFDHRSHFEMWQSWGPKADPSACGAGLIIPGFCGGFADQIGNTSTVYLHGLRANPKIRPTERFAPMARLRLAMITAIKSAGFKFGLMTTSNILIERSFADDFGWERNGEYVMMGDF